MKAKELYGECAKLNVIPNEMELGPLPVKTYSSKYRGVLHKTKLKWRASIGFNYRHIFIGTFDDEKSAALAYNAKAIELLGDKAKLNVIEI
jgi:hypothetical protein